MGTYWDGDGQYQDTYAELESLVPFNGPAKTRAGKLIRALGNIYYDYYNNGWGNRLEEAQRQDILEHWHVIMGHADTRAKVEAFTELYEVNADLGAVLAVDVTDDLMISEDDLESDLEAFADAVILAADELAARE